LPTLLGRAEYANDIMGDNLLVKPGYGQAQVVSVLDKSLSRFQKGEIPFVHTAIHFSKPDFKKAGLAHFPPDIRGKFLPRL